MANKGLAIAGSVGAVLLAAGIALETTGRVFGGTWNGPMWLAARTRYGFLPASYALEEGYTDVSNFITNGGRGVLKVTVGVDGDLVEVSYTAPGASAGDQSAPLTPTPSSTPEIKESKEEGDAGIPVPTEAQPMPDEIPVDKVEPNGNKVYYGWHGVWAWCGSIK
ncbi:MAG: hypothetical protein IKE41_03975 [Clostridia bacterium]|nr:hypothetical protein [Clostridia bacterium]MBR2734658.1 hypothetical protein [Clostridia bacterium]